MKAHPPPDEVRSLVRAQVALERTVAKWRGRWPEGTRCSRCGATNPIALGRRVEQPICYACKTERTSESHSLVGDHLEPRVDLWPNVHKIQDEVLRILAGALLPGVRPQFAIGLAAWITAELTMLGTLGPEP